MNGKKSEAHNSWQLNSYRISDTSHIHHSYLFEFVYERATKHLSHYLVLFDINVLNTRDKIIKRIPSKYNITKPFQSNDDKNKIRRSEKSL